MEVVARGGRGLVLYRGTALDIGSGKEGGTRRGYALEDSFRHSESEVVRSGTFEHLGRGARIFLSPRSSRCHAHLARALRISRVTEAVTHTLELGRSLARTVTLNRSLKRAPFNRTNRDTLGSVIPFSFARASRDIEIYRGLRGRNENLGLAFRILSNVGRRAHNR